LNSKYFQYFFWIVLIIVQTIWISNSDGFYFIDDSSHYNYNRHYTDTYDVSIGSWHRVGRVLLFALPAQFGLKGVQIASSVIFLLTIFFALKILQLKKVNFSYWVIPAIGFQPVLFNISYTALAELPAAFLIILSYYFHIKDKHSSAMLAASFIFIFRTEYFFVAGLLFLIYANKKYFKVLPFVLAGPLFWYLYTTIITGNPMQFFYDMTLHSRLPKIDVGIEFNYYFWFIPKIFGILQTVFFIAALIFLVLNKKIKEYALLFIIFFSGILIQTLLALKGLDLTCSIGQLRYVAVVGPVFGIISVVGMSYFLGYFKNNILLWCVSVLFLGFMFFSGPYSTPFHNKFQIEKVSEEIADIVKNNYPDYKIITNMHQIANALDEPQTGGIYYMQLSDSNIIKTDKALIVWCSYLEGSPFTENDVTLKEIESIPNIKLIKEYIDTVDNCIHIPLYNNHRKNSMFEISNSFIDYMIADQTSWENYIIRVYLKD
jgi:hypothetical protein